MWIGYLSSGVSIIAADRLVTFGQNEGLPPGSITAFARDSGGAIWAATTTGLARFDGTRWRTLGTESGYPGGMTADLLGDRRGEGLGAAARGGVSRPPGAPHLPAGGPPLCVHASGGGGARGGPRG